MTDLQIALMAIGAVIIIGVIVYNRWQEYRAHRRIARAFADAPEDVLMRTASAEDSDARREPLFFRNEVTGVRLEDPAMNAAISITGLDGAPDENVEPEEAAENMADVDDEAIAEDVSETEAGSPAEEFKEPYIDLDGTGDVPVKEEAVLREEEPVAVIAHSVSRSLPVDELIDYVIPLNLDEPIRAEKLLPLIQSFRHTGNKPVHFIGFSEDVQTGEKSWQPILHGNAYHQLKAGVQLANRTGALNEIEYSELVTRLRQLADDIGAEPELPDMMDVLQNARGLYRFVAEHDARLGINVRASGAPWSVKTLMGVLERQKFDLRPDGFFVMHDTDGMVLFSLAVNAMPTSETTNRLTLLLDVPCVAREKDGFAAMVQCAKSLCQRLNGILVDDDDRMLSDPMLNDIVDQVNVFHEEMNAVSIPAGSVRAMRLFN